MRAFGGLLDGVVVHTAENRLQVIAHGVAPDKVWVLPHGVHVRARLTPDERARLRAKLEIPDGEKVIVSLGFLQPNKGVEAVIEAVAHLIAGGVPARGFILGKVNENLPIAVEYCAQLKQLAQKAGVADRITFSNRFHSDAEAGEYLAAADLVMMNYQSRYYEASGACSVAVGAGALVAASLAPQFAPFGDAVWHMTAGFPPGVSAEVLLAADSRVRETVLRSAERYCAENSWNEIAHKLKAIYRQLSFKPAPRDAPAVREKSVPVARKMRVLFQNRPNALTQRGGDTVVMERTMAGLRQHGVEVTVDLQGAEDPAKYDLVHLFNFALPELTRAFAERAHRAGVPYVVTTLCEDVSLFHNHSHVVSAALIEYQRRRQDRLWWEQNRIDPADIPACAPFDNRWTAVHAAALLTNGAHESAVVARNCPEARTIVEVKLGCEVSAAPHADLFEREYGLRDFVLCVGRLESRKNQLMLLKALEDSELPVVLAAGGFSYQPEYEQAVRSFKRRGQTLVLGRISNEMLASAYAGAKVHALASWYELPGLVSLEAARYGCAVVATRNGTAPDYFGPIAFYCDPASESSIYEAVTAAYRAPRNSDLAHIAEQYTWQRTADETYAIYEKVLHGRDVSRREELVDLTTTAQSSATPPAGMPAAQHGGYDMASDVTEFQDALERGELAVKKGEFAKAAELFAKAEGLNPLSLRLVRSQGALALAQADQRKALPLFERALAIEPGDNKALTGAGMCEIMNGEHAHAMKRFITVLSRDPANLVAMGQLVECAYACSQFAELETALRRYVQAVPADVGMQYCLAGCLFKRGDFNGAEEWLAKVAQLSPGHKGIVELRKAIEEERAAQSKRAAESAQAPAAPHETVILSVPEEDPRAFMRKGDGIPPDAFEIETKLSNLEDEKRRKNFAKVKEEVVVLLARRGLSGEQAERGSLLRAEVAVMESDMTTAAEIYTRVLTRNPKSARGLCGRGAIAAHAGNWSDAQRCFEEAHRLQPQYDVALAGLGLCASVAEKRSEAWEYYQQAARINPENVRALLGIIELGYPLNRLAEVQKTVQAYLDLHPADLEYVYALAGCCYAQGKYPEALDALQRIALFDPQHKGAAELRQLIDAKTGQAGKAG